MAFMKVTLTEIADLVRGRVVGDPDLSISGVASFEQAGEHDIAVAGNAGFLKKD
jgi:UDP-3-O-[3-hydroxymyristoyl] glucosamine N-acyltransferase